MDLDSENQGIFDFHSCSRKNEQRNPTRKFLVHVILHKSILVLKHYTLISVLMTILTRLHLP